MKYISYEHENEVEFGVVTGDLVAPLADGSCRTLREAIALSWAARLAVKEPILRVGRSAATRRSTAGR